mgnify:FL=1
MNIEKISEVKTGSYFLRVSDIIDLLNSTDNDAFMAMNLAYNYGFSRGQRAEKARAKKKAVKS